MKNKKNNLHVILLNIGLIFFMIGFTSCDGFQEQIVSVEVPVENVSSVLVLNGEIEKDSIAWVQISYSESIDAPAGTPVNYEENAWVTIETSSGNIEPLSYTSNGMYKGSSIAGTVEETYTLTIEINGQIYSASSTMFPDPGYQEAWITGGMVNEKGGPIGLSYSEEWIVNDPSNTRDRYLFEWYINGFHLVERDWAIDDNRVVNVNEGLRLVNPTIDPGPNEYIVFRAAEIDKITYDYYNMYEKIVRGIIGGDAQTPFNPVSNFGEGTMGNFRAVAFSSITLLTPPNPVAVGQDGQNVIAFPINKFFTKYNLYWSNSADISKENGNVISDILLITENGIAFYSHKYLTNGTAYYYCVEVEDSEGNISVLSSEISVVPNPAVPVDDTPDIDFGDTGGGKGDYDWKGSVSSPYIHTGLSSGVTYYYRVGAYSGEDVYLSEEVSATTR